MKEVADATPYFYVYCSCRLFESYTPAAVPQIYDDIFVHSASQTPACKKELDSIPCVTPQRIRQRILEPHVLILRNFVGCSYETLYMPRELTENVGKFPPPLSIQCEIVKRLWRTSRDLLVRCIRSIIITCRTCYLTKRWCYKKNYIITFIIILLSKIKCFIHLK